MDDFTLSSQLNGVASDVEMITKSAKDIGLVLNPTKCEIICFDDKLANMEVFIDYIRVRPEDMTLLGASILEGPAIDKALSIKVDDLTRAVSRLTQLQAHDGLTLLRNCFSMLKFYSTSYVLRHAAATICWRNLTWPSGKVSQRS